MVLHSDALEEPLSAPQRTIQSKVILRILSFLPFYNLKNLLLQQRTFCETESFFRCVRLMLRFCCVFLPMCRVEKWLQPLHPAQRGLLFLWLAWRGLLFLSSAHRSLLSPHQAQRGLRSSHPAQGGPQIRSQAQRGLLPPWPPEHARSAMGSRTGTALEAAHPVQVLRGF